MRSKTRAALTRKAAEKLKDPNKLHKFAYGNRETKKEDVIKLGLAVKRTTQTEGWKFIESKLLGLADPYKCKDAAGNFDVPKLVASEMIVNVLSYVNGLVKYVEGAQNVGSEGET